MSNHELEKLLPAATEKEREQALRVGQTLRRLGATLAAAESCTGGLVSAILTAVPGASDYFLGGVISYANSIKEELLGVSTSTLIQHGAVSRACVEEMARGVRQAIGATYGIAVSGIAGPGGGTAAKPVGTVHFAVASPTGCVAGEIHQPGEREEIRRRAAHAVLRLLEQVLNDATHGPLD